VVGATFGSLLINFRPAHFGADLIFDIVNRFLNFRRFCGRPLAHGLFASS